MAFAVMEGSLANQARSLHRSQFSSWCEASGATYGKHYKSPVFCDVIGTLSCALLSAARFPTAISDEMEPSSEFLKAIGMLIATLS